MSWISLGELKQGRMLYWTWKTKRKHETKAEAERTEQGIIMMKIGKAFRRRLSGVVCKPACAAKAGNCFCGERQVKRGNNDSHRWVWMSWTSEPLLKPRKGINGVENNRLRLRLWWKCNRNLITDYTTPGVKTAGLSYRVQYGTREIGIARSTRNGDAFFQGWKRCRWQTKP